MNELLKWSEDTLENSKKYNPDNFIYWVVGIIVIIIIILLCIQYYMRGSSNNTVDKDQKRLELGNDNQDDIYDSYPDDYYTNDDMYYS